jgi:hypothetical protein
MRPVLLGNIVFAVALLAAIILLGRCFIRSWVEHSLRRVAARATNELVGAQAQIETLGSRVAFIQRQVGSNTDRLDIVEDDLKQIRESTS